jgi:hypothetical protein
MTKTTSIAFQPFLFKERKMNQYHYVQDPVLDLLVQLNGYKELTTTQDNEIGRLSLELQNAQFANKVFEVYGESIQEFRELLQQGADIIEQVETTCGIAQEHARKAAYFWAADVREVLDGK